MTMRIIPSWLIVLFVLSLSACGGGGSDTGSGQGQGRLELGLTDAPVDSAVDVSIYFTSVTLHGDNGNLIFEVTDENGNPGHRINLLALQSGQWTGLIDETIPAGHYSWIRLGLDLSRSYIETNEGVFGLRCNSCNQNGLRLNRSFNVEQDAVLALMLDFDLRKSITDPNPNDVLGDYILRPTIRTVRTAASGLIRGSVDPTVIASLGDDDVGCSVYVFNGPDATADDVYIPFDNPPDPTQNNPVSTARVMLDNDTYSYTAAFLPAGEYTVALTCDAEMDSAASNDTGMTFTSGINVSVVAGDTNPEPTNFDTPVTP